METQHTPTPEMNYELPVHIAWDDFTNGHRLVDSTGAIVARVKAEDVELPDFIVRAVNSHLELVELLKATTTCGLMEKNPDLVGRILRAIAKAEGR